MYRDWINTINTAEQKGEKKGFKKGEKIGIEKGEKKKAMDMARLMKADNEPIDKIIRYTNLSEEEINSL